jgi:hypothetical protein
VRAFAKSLELDDGTVIPFKKVLIAIGTEPNRFENVDEKCKHLVSTYHTV